MLRRARSLLLPLVLLAALLASPGCRAPRPALPALARSADLDDRRVAYAVEAVALARQRLWPMLDFGAPCIVLFDDRRQRMYGCRETGGSKASLDKAGVGKVIVRPSVEVVGQRIPYDKVKLAWVGHAFVHTSGIPASKPFAHRPWFVIQSREALAAHHPAFGPATSTDEWAAIFLHEYFHIGQMIEPRLQRFFADEIPAKRFRDKSTLAALYRGDGAYRDRVKAEHAALLAAASKRLSGDAARAALCHWHDARRARVAAHQSSFEGDLETYDALWTYVEGTARYTEARLYLDDELQPQLPIRGDRHFSSFAATRGKGVAGLPKGLRGVGPRYVYALGMLASFLLDEAAPGWRPRAVAHRRWLVGVVADLCTGEGPQPGEPKQR